MSEYVCCLSLFADTRAIWRPSLAVVLVGFGRERELESEWNLSSPTRGNANLVRRETKLPPGRNSLVWMRDMHWVQNWLNSWTLLKLKSMFFLWLQMESLFLLWQCWGTWGTWSLWASVRNTILRSSTDWPRRWASLNSVFWTLKLMLHDEVIYGVSSYRML